MTEMLMGTMSVREDKSLMFYFYWNCPLKSLMDDWRSLIFVLNTFFSFLSSLTSLVKFTVYLFNFTMIVFLIVSSIFLNLFVLTT